MLSHDSRGRLRRGRLVCWLLPELHGSYEELPTNLLDYAVRDRRWMRAPAACPPDRRARPNRIRPPALGMGIFAYLAAPLWLAMLMLSSAMVVDHPATWRYLFRAEGGSFSVAAISLAGDSRAVGMTRSCCWPQTAGPQLRAGVDAQRARSAAAPPWC